MSDTGSSSTGDTPCGSHGQEAAQGGLRGPRQPRAWSCHAEHGSQGPSQCPHVTRGLEFTFPRVRRREHWGPGEHSPASRAGPCALEGASAPRRFCLGSLFPFPTTFLLRHGASQSVRHLSPCQRPRPGQARQRGRRQTPSRAVLRWGGAASGPEAHCHLVQMTFVLSVKERCPMYLHTPLRRQGGVTAVFQCRVHSWGGPFPPPGHQLHSTARASALMTSRVLRS